MYLLYKNILTSYLRNKNVWVVLIVGVILLFSSSVVGSLAFLEQEKIIVAVVFSVIELLAVFVVLTQ